MDKNDSYDSTTTSGDKITVESAKKETDTMFVETEADMEASTVTDAETDVVTEPITSAESSVISPETEATPEGEGERYEYTEVNEVVTARGVAILWEFDSRDSEFVHSIKTGEYVRRIGISSNGWSKLEYKGVIVYTISNYLTVIYADTESAE